MFSQFQSVVLLTAVLLRLTSAVVVVQRDGSDICGKKGYDRGNGNYYYSDSSKVNTYAACSAKCATDSTCQSFGVGGACMLFNIPLSGNFDADTGSRDTYYDEGCLSASSSSTSSAKTSSAKTTSSSKTTTSSSAPATSSKTTSSVVAKVSSTTSSTTPTAPSTTPKASSSTKPSSTTSATSTVTVPSGCPAPTAVELTGLSWFNSTHNLDCPSPNYPSGAQVCFDGSHVCVDQYDGVSNGTVVCHCVPYCYTGLPSYAYQPIGYGPPDNISISLSDEAEPSCTAVNPTGFRDFEIGSGHVNCGNAQDIIEFYGDSNKNSGNNGSLYYNGYVYNTYTACKGTPRYGGSFPLSCTRDAGGNATCGLKNGPVTLTLLSFQ